MKLSSSASSQKHAGVMSISWYHLQFPMPADCIDSEVFQFQFHLALFPNLQSIQIKIQIQIHAQAVVDRATKRSRHPEGLAEAAVCSMRCCRAPELATGCAMRKLRQRMNLGPGYAYS